MRTKFKITSENIHKVSESIETKLSLTYKQILLSIICSLFLPYEDRAIRSEDRDNLYPHENEVLTPEICDFFKRNQKEGIMACYSASFNQDDFRQKMEDKNKFMSEIEPKLVMIILSILNDDKNWQKVRSLNTCNFFCIGMYVSLSPINERLIKLLIDKFTPFDSTISLDKCKKIAFHINDDIACLRDFLGSVCPLSSVTFA